MINTSSLIIDAETLRLQELAEKKKRRLERNRASARECRKRKKEKKLLLRQQLIQLEEENLQLRLRLQIGSESLANHNIQSAMIVTRLNELIMEGASEADIEKKIMELKERFSDYGRDRRSSIDYHIQQLRRCLQPTQTTRAILWLMSLAAKFHEVTLGRIPNFLNTFNFYPPSSSSTGERSSTSSATSNVGLSSSSASSLATPANEFQIEGTEAGGSQAELAALWSSLLEEVKPDFDQRNLMISYTSSSENDEDPFTKIRRVTDKCNETLDRIVEFINYKNNCLDQEMNHLHSILSPKQIAKFILWIDKNPACMQMLEALWPHITSTTSSSYNNNSPTHSHNGYPSNPYSSYSPNNNQPHKSQSFQSFSASTDNLASLDDQDGDESDDMSTGSES